MIVKTQMKWLAKWVKLVRWRDAPIRGFWMRHRPFNTFVRERWMRVLVTGGAGFIGSAVCRYFILDLGHDVVVIDKLTYAGNLASLAPVADNPRYAFEKHDICDVDAINAIFAKYRPDAVVHLAAESHVDRSISGSDVFVKTNVLGTFTLLEAARKYLASARKGSDDFRFVHVSTDEVYGSLGDDGLFTETTPYDP